MKAKAPARPDPQSKYLSIPEAAAVLHISVRGFYRLLKERDGPPIRRLSPRKVVVPADDLDVWVKAQTKHRKRSRSRNGAVPAPLG